MNNNEQIDLIIDALQKLKKSNCIYNISTSFEPIHDDYDDGTYVVPNVIGSKIYITIETKFNIEKLNGEDNEKQN